MVILFLPPKVAFNCKQCLLIIYHSFDVYRVMIDQYDMTIILVFITSTNKCTSYSVQKIPTTPSYSTSSVIEPGHGSVDFLFLWSVYNKMSKRHNGGQCILIIYIQCIVLAPTCLSLHNFLLQVLLERFHYML